MTDSKGAAIDDSLKKIVRDIAGWDKNTTDDLICRLDEGAVSAHTKAILALLAQEVNSGILEVLGRINDKATVCALAKGTNYEDLAKVYDGAIMNELAELTASRKAGLV